LAGGKHQLKRAPENNNCLKACKGHARLLADHHRLFVWIIPNSFGGPMKMQMIHPMQVMNLSLYWIGMRISRSQFAPWMMPLHVDV
jgi:hypothetical protein